MKQKKDATAITNSLKRLEGQLRGIIKMIEDDRGCEEILIQISSVKSALQKTGQALLENHVYQCVLDAMPQSMPQSSNPSLPQSSNPSLTLSHQEEAGQNANMYTENNATTSADITANHEKKAVDILASISAAIEQFSRLV